MITKIYEHFLTFALIFYVWSFFGIADPVEPYTVFPRLSSAMHCISGQKPGQTAGQQSSKQSGQEPGLLSG